MRYDVVLHRSDEAFAASVTGLPGCRWLGTTEPEVRSAIEEYLSVVDEQLRDHRVRVVHVTIGGPTDLARPEEAL